MPAKTDNLTMALISQVREQKAAIAKAERPQYKTNCSFQYVEGDTSKAINIHVENNVRSLILMAAFLLERASHYRDAAIRLGVEDVPKFSWCGFSSEDWIDDIRLRINKIQIAAQRLKLERLEARLNNIISPELRAKMELEDIASELAAG